MWSSNKEIKTKFAQSQINKEYVFKRSSEEKKQEEEEGKEGQDKGDKAKRIVNKTKSYDMRSQQPSYTFAEKVLIK